MVAYCGETDTLSYKTFTINTNKQLDIFDLFTPHTACMLLLPGEVN